MKNVMYAAIAFAAIAIGGTAIGVGKAANAYGEYITIDGSLHITGVDFPSSLSIRCRSGCN